MSGHPRETCPGDLFLPQRDENLRPRVATSPCSGTEYVLFEPGWRVPDGDPEPSSKWLRYTSLGFELGAAVALPTLLGVWIDRRWGSEPWGFLAGFCLGLAGGLYRFIRTSMVAMRQAATDDRKDRPYRPAPLPVEEEPGDREQDQDPPDRPPSKNPDANEREG